MGSISEFANNILMLFYHYLVKREDLEKFLEENRTIPDYEEEG